MPQYDTGHREVLWKLSQRLARGKMRSDRTRRLLLLCAVAHWRSLEPYLAAALRYQHSEGVPIERQFLDQMEASLNAEAGR